MYTRSHIRLIGTVTIRSDHSLSAIFTQNMALSSATQHAMSQVPSVYSTNCLKC